MLRTRFLFAVALVVMIEALSSGAAHAKTTVELDPSSGPGGTVVRMRGDGFCAGEVSLQLALSNPIEPGASSGTFVADASQLPKSMHLATAMPNNGSFETTFVMPGRNEVAAYLAEQAAVVYVLAVHPGQEGCNRPTETFAIGAAYAFTGTDLPSAGTGLVPSSQRGTQWMMVALALAGGMLFSIGWLVRRA